MEQPDGTVVTVIKDELDELAVPSSHEIDVVQFAPAEQIDPVLFTRSYYAEPDSRAVKPYVLLLETLRETDRIAIGRIALRQRETLAALRVHDDVIVVQTMLWPDEVREPTFELLRTTEVRLRPQEKEMAVTLVDSLTCDFDPHAYTDRYTEAVAELIEAKAASPEQPRPKPAASAEPAEASSGDLVSVLRASVEQARAQRHTAPVKPTQADDARARPA